MSFGLPQFILLSSVLFAIGVYGLLTRRTAVGVLMCVEILLNAAALNFAVFNKWMNTTGFDGALMVIFLIAVAAAEVVVAMAIFVSIYKLKKTLSLEKMDQLKW